MLYLTNLIRFPYTGALHLIPNKATKFSCEFDQNKVYKWTFSRALNEVSGEKILDFKQDKMKLLFNGLLANSDRKYLKFNFHIRVRLLNGTDFSLAKCNYVTTSINNIINKKLKLNSQVKEFVFQPYKDIIYLSMTVKDNKNQDNSEPINLSFTTFGFDLVRNN